MTRQYNRCRNLEFRMSSKCFTTKRGQLVVVSFISLFTASSYTTAVVCLMSSVFWGLMPRRLISGSRGLETTQWRHLKRSKSHFLEFSTLDDETTRLPPETSGNNNWMTRRLIQDDRSHTWVSCKFKSKDVKQEDVEIAECNLSGCILVLVLSMQVTLPRRYTILERRYAWKAM